MIFTGFSPNLTGRDVLKALGWLCLPWKWLKLLKGEKVVKVERELSKYFSVKQTFAFDSGRSALYFALKALEVKESDEVLVQAFTCVVVANAIRWTGARPVYVDVGADFNLDCRDLEKKITPRTKVLIIQHTYGLPADMEKLMAVAKKYGLKIIEDCAHSFGAKHNGIFTGLIGDIGMFSFGSDKILSCARGGALITNDEKIGREIGKMQKKLKSLELSDVIRHLLHFPIFYISKPLYNLLIGKAILVLAKKLNWMNKIITQEEKAGKKDELFGRAMPNALADILLGQLKDVDHVNSQRIEIAKLYDEELSDKFEKPLKQAQYSEECVYLRYPILLENPKDLMKYAKKHKIMLGDWYDAVIGPKDIDLEKTGYVPGSCPKAERLVRRVVNLPTGRCIGDKEAHKVIQVVNTLFNK